MKSICHQYYSLNRKERSHDPENHCGNLIILDLAKSPFVNTVLRQNFAETKVLTLRPHLSLRPGAIFTNRLKSGFELKFKTLVLNSVNFTKGLKLSPFFWLSQGLKSKTLVLTRSGT